MKLPDRRLPHILVQPSLDRSPSVHPNTVRELEELIIKAFYLAHDIAGLAQHDQPQLHNINTLAAMVLRQWAIAQGNAIDGSKDTEMPRTDSPEAEKFG
jgi:hypothetical protein